MRVQFFQSVDFNQMLVFSVFGHLLLLTVVLFLPKPSIQDKPIVPAFMVNLVSEPTGFKTAAAKPSKPPAKAKKPNAKKMAKKVPAIKKKTAIKKAPAAKKTAVSKPDKLLAIQTPNTKGILEELGKLETKMVVPPNKSMMEELDQLARLEKPKRKPVVTKPVKSVSEETFRELESLKNKKINEVKAVAPAPLQEDILKNFDELKMEKSLIETPSKEIPKKSPIKPVPEKKKLQKTVVPEDDLLKELQQLAMLGSSPASEVKSREREPQTSAQKSSESFNSLADKFSSLSVESEPVKVEVSSARLDSSSFQSKLRSLPKPSRTRTESSTGDSFVLAKKDGVPGADIQSLYVGMIKEKIFKNWREPLAQEHNQETVVSFYIFPKGNADKPVIKKSSGVEALDTLAVRAILDSVPFPEFPEGLKASNLHLEMYFKYVPKED